MGSRESLPGLVHPITALALIFLCEESSDLVPKDMLSAEMGWVGSAFRNRTICVKGHRCPLPLNPAFICMGPMVNKFSGCSQEAPLGRSLSILQMESGEGCSLADDPAKEAGGRLGGKKAGHSGGWLSLSERGLQEHLSP